MKTLLSPFAFKCPRTIWRLSPYPLASKTPQTMARLGAPARILGVHDTIKPSFSILS